MLLAFLCLFLILRAGCCRPEKSGLIQAYVRNIYKNHVKDPKYGEEIISCLGSKGESLYTFEVRKIVGLIDPSYRIEQANNISAFERQRRTGWTGARRGSPCHYAFAMMYKDKVQDSDYQARTVSIEVHEAKMPKRRRENVVDAA